MDGGVITGKVLASRGVRFIFTLCGGHISPVLKGCKDEGIRVIDVRHEATAVFAADAVSRLSGLPGVAAVTAGPGLTNTITAVKNAALAQSPLLLLGGATATVLKGRGSLQDIDQVSLLKPHVKWLAAVKRVRDIAPALHAAFRIAQEGVPGPVFVELPIDILYGEALVREWYGVKSSGEGGKRSMGEKFLSWYLRRHVSKLFRGMDGYRLPAGAGGAPSFPHFSTSALRKTAGLFLRARRPVMLIGSQAMLRSAGATNLAKAVSDLGVPVYLSGMARGLLGANAPLRFRHARKAALREADLILLAGVPCDFRLDYGRHLGRKATCIAVNRSRKELRLNRRPHLAIHGDPQDFLISLAGHLRGKGGGAASPPPEAGRKTWFASLKEREDKREDEIAEMASVAMDKINPVSLFRALDPLLGDQALLVADGGDFAATASYSLNPRAPLSWLDPGVFGTLGVGAGFALGAKLCRPEAEVWIIYGDGSCAYSLAEYDTFARHHIPVISLVGNDACWSQIAREQTEILHDDVATALAHSDYHLAAAGYGGAGLRLERMEDLRRAIEEARNAVKKGKPFLINAIIGKTEFRKGSISM